MKTSFRILLGLAVLVGFASPTVRAQGPGKDEKDLKLLAGDKDKALQLQVNNAVQKGADWLKSVQNPNGTWTCCWAKYAAPHNYPMGETALALLALLKSGENPESECIKKGFAWLRTQPLQKTYEVGTLLMALEALYAPKSPPPIDPKEITQVVKQAVKVPPADLDWMRQCTEFLLRVMIASQRMKGEDTGAAAAYKDTWHYPMGAAGDHSNTQFALLGLKSASKCGIQIPEDVWINTIKHFLEIQERDGPQVMRMQLIEDRQHGYVSYKPLTGKPDKSRGWCYGATVDPKAGSADKVYATTGSMTCVGISSVAIAMAELGPKAGPLKEQGERAIWDGIAWLETNWKIDANPCHPAKLWLYYYLYGLERTGVLTWQRSFGKHDWYREGAEYLVAHQSGGGWDDPNCPGPVNNTCFALLFLTRATVPGRAVVTGGAGGH